MSNQAKIHQLRGPLSPPAFLSRFLESSTEIENIAVVVKWKGEHAPTNVYWTEMLAGDAAWLDWVFRTDFMAMLMGDKERT